MKHSFKKVLCSANDVTDAKNSFKHYTRTYIYIYIYSQTSVVRFSRDSKKKTMQVGFTFFSVKLQKIFNAVKVQGN